MEKMRFSLFVFVLLFCFALVFFATVSEVSVHDHLPVFTFASKENTTPLWKSLVEMNVQLSVTRKQKIKESRLGITITLPKTQWINFLPLCPISWKSPPDSIISYRSGVHASNLWGILNANCNTDDVPQLKTYKGKRIFYSFLRL